MIFPINLFPNTCKKQERAVVSPVLYSLVLPEDTYKHFCFISFDRGQKTVFQPWLRSPELQPARVPISQKIKLVSH